MGVRLPQAMSLGSQTLPGCLALLPSLPPQVEVTRNVEGQEEHIRVLKAGDHFGELSLIR